MKFLIIQQKMIGDVLTSTILCERIKAEYPNSEIHYLINSNTIPVVENNPFIDHIVEFKNEFRSNKKLFLTFLKNIQSKKFDITIDVYSKVESAIITYFSRSKIRIGYKKWYTKLFYTNCISLKKISDSDAGLAIENRLLLLEPILKKTDYTVKPKIHLTDLEITQAKDYLIANNISFNNPIFMISILGSGKNKTLPFQQMALLLDDLVKVKPNAQLLFNYIPNQVEDAQSILELCKLETQKNIFFNVFGKSLRDFLSITSHCSAVIGNEGGAINMAKALDVNTFAIFAPWIQKESWNLFDDDEKHCSVHLKDYSTNFYTKISHPKKLKSKALDLYQEFEYDLFKSEIEKFVKQF